MGQAYAVLTAAGSGQRLGADKPKALVTLEGQTLLSWAVRALAESGEVRAICVTAPHSHLSEFQRAIPPVSVPVWVVAGGPSRQASVRRGLLGLQERLPAEGLQLEGSSPVLVHDAARCFAPPGLIAALVTHVRDGLQAVVPGVPVADTIKRVARPADGNANPLLVEETPNRDCLRSIQTPQAFQWSVLVSAHDRAQAWEGNENTSATDDAALVEAAGTQVWVIPGDPRAGKITTGEDLRHARSWVP